MKYTRLALILFISISSYLYKQNQDLKEVITKKDNEIKKALNDNKKFKQNVSDCYDFFNSGMQSESTMPPTEDNKTDHSIKEDEYNYQLYLYGNK